MDYDCKADLNTTFAKKGLTEKIYQYLSVNDESMVRETINSRRKFMKAMENDWYKKIWTLDIQSQSWVEDVKRQVDFSGNPSSDNNIQLMVYSKKL